jgi:hypothetical protein
VFSIRNRDYLQQQKAHRESGASRVFIGAAGNSAGVKLHLQAAHAPILF